MANITIFINTGDRFGKWEVLSYVGRLKDGTHAYNCVCDCGVTRVVRKKKLTNGTSKSCGCVSREAIATQTLTHGMTDTIMYSKWRSMLRRCYDQNSAGYQYYGGRGIAVSPAWHRFENFYSDMGDPPSKEMTLERIDVNADYSKENCKWATIKEQNRNQRRSYWVTYENQTRCASEWAEIFGLRQDTLIWRLENGWAIGDALTKPVKQRKR